MGEPDVEAAILSIKAWTNSSYVTERFYAMKNGVVYRHEKFVEEFGARKCQELEQVYWQEQEVLLHQLYRTRNKHHPP